MTTRKPVPTDAIASDPQAEARYNAAVESWGDRLYAAGVRICLFMKDTGMKGVDCE